MKTNRTFTLIILVAVLILGTSCKKSETIRKNLWDNGGKWMIEEMSMMYEEYEDGEIVYSENEFDYNVGCFQFFKDSTLVIVIDENSDTSTVNYEITEHTLILHSGGEFTVFDFEWEKNQITLARTFEDEHEKWGLFWKLRKE